MINEQFIASVSCTHLPNHHPVNIACLAGEVHADADDLLAVELEGERVVLVLNLLEGLLGGAVKLEFEDIAIVLGLDEHVDASLAGVVFGLGVEAHQA